jgi:hypothetical protein
MEQRRYARRHLIYQLEVRDADTGHALGRIVDIGVGGFRIVGRSPASPGKVLRLTMKLPESVSGEDTLSVEALCIWSQRDSSPELYVAGFQISPSPGQNPEAIVSVLERYYMT